MRALLYSTNPLMAYQIMETYRGGKHRVWCSEVFDARRTDPLSVTALVPPSSNPAELYRDARDAIKRGDRHYLRIELHRTKLAALAVQWELMGEITGDQSREIQYMVKHAPLEQWRPLLYLIPKAGVVSKTTLVPPDKRAGGGPEYIVEDLTRPEFDVIEFEL